ncbi:putative uncharacterized MFS-type transporter [Clavispora lusitaniae]|uniref:Uncharacterized MFS-type transporter n=1 Tax=Clavispora lusitaniae TaxID=36911 RepID=A0ACD0WFU0_CLALS|nr:Major Facilitator Superfamily protein [Clavispora lusitaniae]QFZ26101.1 putative uncharacterized MFS-type transporter [Clavispora lusitaniae]QFZ36264.1 putative uncharacterized MFS-type transporter [Clavispora lusitaniae]QFZ41948.1 putative uncharacterized MFS-type transporter [Clavispora lusitaniae]QFZ47624.1 putative uncharacterized MFS-type transporter [Clavispora lusitaniae]
MTWLKYKDDLDVPGTSTLVDANHVLASAAETKDDIVYIPQPSDSPDDPLNWSTGWKISNYAILIFFVLVASATSTWKGVLYGQFIVEFGVTFNKLNTGAGLLFLFLALGCWFTQVIACIFGRRPTYLFFTMVVLLGSVAFAASKTYHGYLAYCILDGFGIAPMDTLVQASLSDIFFLHQHGRLMAIYTLALGTGSSWGPIIAGYMASYTSTWSWINYTIIILMGTILLLEICFLRESYYDRSSTITSTEGWDSSTNTSEKVHAKVISEEVTPTGNASFLSKMKFMKPMYQKNTLFEVGIAPFRTLRYPAVVWVAVGYGIQMCWLSLTSLTVSQFFAAPPYLFSTAALGNVNYAGIVGSVAGPIYVGFSDKYCIWRAKRNNGISEPEFRLDLMWLPLILNTLGLLLYGLGPAYKLSWVVGMFGIGLINFGISTITACMLTYVMECYPAEVTQTMSTLLFIRNIIGAIFNWVFQDWLDAMGIKKFTALMAVLCLVFNGFAIVFVIWGKAFRKFTAKWYTKSLPVSTVSVLPN